MREEDRVIYHMGDKEMYSINLPLCRAGMSHEAHDRNPAKALERRILALLPGGDRQIFSRSLFSKCVFTSVLFHS